jgi:hypothetical protein
VRVSERSRRGAGVGAVLAAAAVVLGSAVAGVGADRAHAEPPVSLSGAYVLDQADVLSAADEQRVGESLDALSADSGVDLFVVYVDSFSSPADRAAWGSATASLNQLGPDDVLLSVAVDDRVYDLRRPRLPRRAGAAPGRRRRAPPPRRRLGGRGGRPRGRHP